MAPSTGIITSTNHQSPIARKRRIVLMDVLINGLCG
jgi:hypothetical protein